MTNTFNPLPISVWVTLLGGNALAYFSNGLPDPYRVYLIGLSGLLMGFGLATFMAWDKARRKLKAGSHA